ncbi:hypothetical protein EYR41_009620 [Orbilia oligospora]|uniref:Uncharacterized protein n=1 Tax=Orbilia oligospora TaxID=2813651 RepID=A0A7C8P7A1_ORBOL|nr:hypothetical protein TWF751_010690 [Orbilia oligospora]TGJ65670.1 hypothetical protein EYR41_009620 [Orbilia oligospora]
MSHSLYIVTYDRGTHWDTGLVKAYHWAFLIELSPSTGLKHQLRGMPGAYYYPGPEAADPRIEEPGRSIMINTNNFIKKKSVVGKEGGGGDGEEKEAEGEEEEEEEKEEEEEVVNGLSRDESAAQIVVAKLEIGSVEQSRLGEFEKACREAYVEKEEVQGGEGGWNCQEWCLGLLEGLKGKDLGKDVWYGKEELKGWLKEKDHSTMALSHESIDS